MHPQVRKLLDAQGVAQRQSRLRKRMESIPIEREKRQAEVDRARAAHEARVAVQRAAEVAQRETEVAIKQADADLQKLEGRLNTVKNNAEYQATLLQMESLRRERGSYEERGLELLDDIETAKTVAVESAALLEEKEQEFREFCAEGEAFVAEKRGELDALTEQLRAAMADVDVNVRELYERIFEARGGMGVVAVEGNTCTGCYTSVPPNLLVKVQAGSAVIQCDACQRILYLPGSD